MTKSLKKSLHIEALESRTLFSSAATTTFPTETLTAAQVTQIINQAAAVSLPSQTIVVVDLNGDVLGMYGQAPAAKNQTAGTSNVAALTENTAQKYALLEATAKARTAAFFESTQDSFTTRTARFIVQNDFPQPIANTEAGPLLGVEFSNAAGTDALPPGIGTGLAAGLSGSPGGFPLYIDGQPVGGVGVAGDGEDVAARQDLVPQAVPGLPFAQQSPAFKSDPTGAYYTGAENYDFDEAVSEAAAAGFTGPSSIISTNILVNGLTLPYVAEDAASGPPPSNIPGLTNNGQTLASLPPRKFFAYAPLGKTSAAPITTPPNIYPTTTIPLPDGRTIPVELKNNNPAVGGAGPTNSSNPFVSNGGMVPSVGPNNSVTWTPGNFGFIPGQPVEGTSVHLTKKDILQVSAQALLESQSIIGAIRQPADVPAQVHVAVTDLAGNILAVTATPDATNFSFDVAVQKARTAAFFSDDTHAFTSRAIGFIADSTIPPAIENGATGPLYQLQQSLALPFNEGALLPNVTELINGVPTVVKNPLGDGITIFPGGAPLYKDGKLVGAIGISGDGVDQDDLIAFAGTAGFRPDTNIESDSLSSSQIVSFLQQKINELGYVPPAGMPHFTFPTLSSLQANFGLDDPDAAVGNPDGIVLTASDTIITRILERLSADGVDGVNLPYQKFPRVTTL